MAILRPRSLPPSRARRVRRGLAAAALAMALAAPAAFAQFGGVPEGPWVPPRYRTPGQHDVGLTHCKVMYQSNRRERNGMGWATDYPYAAINLLTRVGELTKTTISRDTDGSPNYWVVRLSDPALFECPFTMATDVGTAQLSAAEVAGLRDYLLKGGFLWVDDFWGPRAWDQWAGEMRKVLPEHQIVDVPVDHAIRTTMFAFAKLPQVTSINFWRMSGGDTSERGPVDSPFANFRMIADAHGRVMVLMTHNTDIGDSWEREGEDPEFFRQFSPEGYAVGINAVLYMLTH